MTSNGSLQAVAAAPPRDRYVEGEVIAGRYELVRRIGEGGMGVVWVARSRGLGVDVALKLLHSTRVDEVSVERMAREARAAAHLGHSAIVRVLDFGKSENGQPFMAMELLQGEDLFRVLKRTRRLSAVEAVSLILPIVDALVVAHKHGIIHRDLKPENIFIATDKRGRVEPKILDFGIAKLEVDDKRLTQIGTVLGSPAYLSPEQAEGTDQVDHRGDIWSLGVVLYEAVTGALPFDGKTSTAVLHSIILDHPRPIIDFAAGNDALWTIIRKCLHKNPPDRWNSMQELGEALARWLIREGMDVDASSRSLRETWLSTETTKQRLRLASVQKPALEETPDATSEDTQSVPPDVVRTTQIRERLANRWIRRLAVAAVGAVVALVVRHYSSAPKAAASEQSAPAAARLSVSPQAVSPAPAAPAVVAPTPAVEARAAEPPPVASSRAPGARGSENVAGAKKPKTARKPPKVDAEFGF
jgi:serine/threonine-protein kinase